MVLGGLYSQQQQQELKELYIFLGLDHKEMNFAEYLQIPKLDSMNLIIHLY